MTQREALRLAVERIKLWPPEEQAWWRELLEVAPAEALVVARLVIALDARPVEE